MEKKAVIAPDLTPSESGSAPGEKQASVPELEKHPTKRLSDKVEETIEKAKKKES